MFLRYFDFVFQPFRWIRAQIMGVRNVRGRVRVDVGRVKNYRSLAKSQAKEARQMAGKAKQKAADARGRLGGGAAQLGAGQPMPAGAGAGGAMPGAMQGAMQGGMHGAMPGAMQGARPGGQGGGQAGAMAPRPLGYHPPGGGPGPGGGMSGPGPHMGGPGPHMSGPGPQVAPGGMPGYAGGPAGGAGPLIGQNGIVVTGALWWKKYLCAQCGQQLDKTWDRCPYCMGAAPVGALKTQAIMLDAAGTGNGLQLCGWLVALKGPQRGELFTLEPVSSVGTDAGCTVVLADQYMSSRHCEIRAEGGTWMLRDLKSTNGTYVNDKRIEQHELVDSDFLRLGQVVLKFKSL